MDVLTRIADEIYRPSCGFSRRNVEKWVERVIYAADEVGLTICNLKPLAELLGCEPETGALTDAVRKLRAKSDRAFVSGMNAKTRGSILGKSALSAIAKALNWERTEFDTLDELLEEIREAEQAHSNFVDAAIRDEERMRKVRELLCMLAETLGSTPLLDEAIELLEPRRYDDDLVELDSAKLEALRKPSGFAEGGYVKEPPSGQVAAVLRPTHTLLHAGELYREATILLHTEQLVAWRTADGQEYSAKAHQVLLDPDEDGLAAAILSRIAGVEIAPEHMAELRAQMAGGVTHG